MSFRFPAGLEPLTPDFPHDAGAAGHSNGFRRVEAVVRVGNEPSERVLDRTGFTPAGVTRRFLRCDGPPVDSTLLSRVGDDR